MKSFTYFKHGCAFDCYPNEEKRIVVVKLHICSRSQHFRYSHMMDGKWRKDMANSEMAIAKCHPDDRFDAMRGASVGATRILTGLLSIMARFHVEQYKRANMANLQILKAKTPKEEVGDMLEEKEPNEACIG